MPQASNIAILNGVPATVTFKPKSVGEIAVFQDDSTVSIAGRPECKISHRPATASAAAKTRLVMKVPVEAVVDGTTVVVRENTIIIDVLTSGLSTLAERKDLRTLGASLLSDALVTSVIEGGEKVW